MGTDTVGPALYDPKVEFAKRRAPINNFHVSKQNRRVFEPSIEITNALPAKENPGPAHYDSVGKIPPKQFHVETNGSVMAAFISKVPNCENLKIPNQENPGPGAYIKD